MISDLKNPLEFKVVAFLTQGKYKIHRHVLGNAVLIIFIFSLQPKDGLNFFQVLISQLFVLSFFYVNLYVLVPFFLFRRSYVKYLIAFFFTMFLSLILSEEVSKFFINSNNLDANMSETPFLLIFIAYGIVLSPFIFLSTGVKIFQRWIIYNERFKEIEKNTVEMELKALKNQINPHFVFNTLNNLNYMILKDQQKASIILLQLSNFLSHHLYKSNQKYVSLDSEIKFIQDFLSLEVIRRDEFTFNVAYPEDEVTNIDVSPNIFSVFIENAIKFSLDPNAPSSISISFHLYDSFLMFTCSNTKAKIPENKINHGVGLKNVKRRLELIYEDSFDLTITDLDRLYKVELIVPV